MIEKMDDVDARNQELLDIEQQTQKERQKLLSMIMERGEQLEKRERELIERERELLERERKLEETKERLLALAKKLKKDTKRSSG